MSKRFIAVPPPLASQFSTFADIRDQVQPDPFCPHPPPAEKEYLRRKVGAISREVADRGTLFLQLHGFTPGGNIPKKRR